MCLAYLFMGKVIAVNKSPTHQVTKESFQSIEIITGLGVAGDAHMGKFVKHRSRVAADPTQPNLRQVHLIHTELFDELKEKGFQIEPGMMGENISTQGIDLLSLPRGTQLHIGNDNVCLEITGLRNPCIQLDGIQAGLMKAVLDKDENGKLIRKAGIMSIVISGGIINRGDHISIKLPSQPHYPLEKV